MKELLLRDLETNSKQNGFLLQNIVARYQQSEDVATLFALEEYDKKLNAATIQEARAAPISTRTTT